MAFLRLCDKYTVGVVEEAFDKIMSRERTQFAQLAAQASATIETRGEQLLSIVLDAVEKKASN